MNFTYRLYALRGVFSPNPTFFKKGARLAPHELTHVRASPGDSVRRAGRKRGARFESSEALAEQLAVARSAVELHPCCARVSRAADSKSDKVYHLVGKPLKSALLGPGAKKSRPFISNT